jgi:hypothetical protein
VSSYAAAAEADAAETERVAVAALMHDSVLAALIAAERAATPARTPSPRRWRARRSPGSPTPSRTPARARRAGSPGRRDRELGSPSSRVCASHRRRAATPRRSPDASRAIVLAATQAVANAVQHAGGRGLSVELGTGSRRVVVRIVDTGDGFARRGRRRSPRHPRFHRRAHGGRRRRKGRVHTSDAGTQVVLEWERPR